LKAVKICVVVILMCLFLSFSANAQGEYTEHYHQSGLSQVFEELPKEVKDFLDDKNLDCSDINWSDKLSGKSVLSGILGFFKDGLRGPAVALCEIIGLLLISAAVSAFSVQSQIGEMLDFIMSVIIALVLIYNTYSVISIAVSAIKSAGVFMLSFVPIFGGIVLASGKTATSVAMSSLLLGAAEVVVQLTSFVILPFMSAYLGVGISAGVSPLLKNSAIGQTLKGVIMWVLGLVFTFFSGLLTVQTTVAAASDGLALRTARFMVTSFVPVAGGALGEAISVITSAASALKSSAGMFAVVCLVLIMLPVLAQLIIWRAVVGLATLSAGVLAIPKAPEILKAVDSVFAVLIGIILFVAALFIISLAVVAKAGG